MLTYLNFISLSGRKELIEIKNENDFIYSIIETISKKFDISMNSYVLAYKGKIISLNNTFSYYNLNNDSTINLLFKLTGG